MLYGGPATVVRALRARRCAASPSPSRDPAARRQVYGFLGCFLFATPMALSMAEISSPFVTAGGPYYWVSDNK